MFNIDTGDKGGSKGPWLSWSSNGSAMKGLKPASWALRGKDDAGNKFDKNVPAFEDGCVLDIDSLELGWEKDGGQGQAPVRVWNPDLSSYAPRPDDSQKPTGGSAWSKCLSIRVAYAKGEAASWEQSSFGAFDAFSKVIAQVSAEYAEKSDNGRLLPLVKQTSVETLTMPRGTSSKPVLEVVQWIERPDSLKDDLAPIATGESVAQAQATPAAPGATEGGF